MRCPVPQDFVKRLHELDQTLVIHVGVGSRYSNVKDFQGKEVKVVSRDTNGGWQVKLVEQPWTTLVVQTGQLKMIKEIELGEYL